MKTPGNVSQQTHLRAMKAMFELLVESDGGSPADGNTGATTHNTGTAAGERRKTNEGYLVNALVSDPSGWATWLAEPQHANAGNSLVKALTPQMRATISQNCDATLLDRVLDEIGGSIAFDKSFTNTITPPEASASTPAASDSPAAPAGVIDLRNEPDATHTIDIATDEKAHDQA